MTAKTLKAQRPPTKQRAERIARYEKLGKSFTFEEIGELEGLSASAVKRFCNVYGITVKRKKYVVTKEVMAARKAAGLKRRKNSKESAQYRKDTAKLKKLSSKVSEEQRIMQHKQIAASNIVCHRWI